MSNYEKKRPAAEDMNGVISASCQDQKIKKEEGGKKGGGGNIGPSITALHSTAQHSTASREVRLVSSSETESLLDRRIGKRQGIKMIMMVMGMMMTRGRVFLF